MDRRDFFRSLVASGATVTQRPQSRNRREHHLDTVLYHGPMEIPAHVAEAVRESPELAKSTCSHLVARFAEGELEQADFEHEIEDAKDGIGNYGEVG